MLVEAFVGKHEKYRRAKIEFRQTVDEQWIMFVHTALTNWSKDPTQRLTERALFMSVEGVVLT